MAIFSDEKVTKLFKDFNAMVGIELPADQLEQAINLCKAQTSADLIDCLSESEETKVALKKAETQEQQIHAANLIKTEVPVEIREDVYLASIQRYLELALRLAQKENPLPEEKLEEVEYYIAEIDKKELKDSGFESPKPIETTAQLSTEPQKTAEEKAPEIVATPEPVKPEVADLPTTQPNAPVTEQKAIQADSTDSTPSSQSQTQPQVNLVAEAKPSPFGGGAGTDMEPSKTPQTEQNQPNT